MKRTKEEKKKAIFILAAWIIVIIVILILWQWATMNKATEQSVVVQTNEERIMEICQEKITNDFQLVDPEFVRNADNNIDSNSLKWHVIYQDTADSVITTDFECIVWNNWNEVWINWDRVNNPSADDVIYDDRN